MYKQNYNRFFARGGRHRTFDPSSIIENLKKAPQSSFDDTYVVRNSFSGFNISSELKNSIASRGFLTPTPIQDQAIPLILDGRDVVGIANTGTGKTAAFLIPLIDKVIKDRRQGVLIITPTRELAVQIENELYSFSKTLRIYSAVCIGGMPIKRQIYSLRRNPSFVIGTPGRLLDLSSQKSIDFTKYETAVFDEVDRMLDMGFLPDVERIVKAIPVSRQSLFFSATVNDKVRGVMGRFTANPVTVSVKRRDSLENVLQDVVRVRGNQKVDVLSKMLYRKECEKVLVFGRTKRGIENLKKTLLVKGFRADAIHGNKTQPQRQKALSRFRRGEIKILLATDVASRGLDIENVSHVVNFDLPETYEDYIHRIGRTGRANKKGVALTFVE